jgi:hypothetical protein
MPETVHAMYHDPYMSPYALNFSESLKIYSEAEIEPIVNVFATDIKLIDRASGRYDASVFARKIDELIGGGALKPETQMVQVFFYPWNVPYQDMVGTINGKPVGAPDAKYIYYDTPDLYDRLSDPNYVRGFKGALSAINSVATSRGLRFVYSYVDEPTGKIDRLIIADRLHTYTRELGLKTWTTGAPSIPTRLNQGGYTGSVSEIPPLSGLTDYNIVDTADGYYTTQSSFIRFPIYNRFTHGIYAFARNWKFLDAYALGDANQDPFDDFDYKPNGGYDNAGPDYIFGYTALDGTWLPTMAYEGIREGIRDDRYLSTLNELINSSGNSSAVNNAKAYLDNIKQKAGRLAWYQDLLWKIKPHGFYDAILSAISPKGEDDFEFFSDMREQIVDHIIKIKNLNISGPPPANNPSNDPNRTGDPANPTQQENTTPTPTPYVNPNQPNNNPLVTTNVNNTTNNARGGNSNTLIPYVGSYVAPSVGGPNPKDYPLLDIPVTDIDTSLPSAPSWVEILREMIVGVVDTVVVGFKNTIDLIR